MSKKHHGKQTGRPVTHEIPIPAGGVRLETFVPWRLVQRGSKKQIITPLDSPQEFLSEAAREREARAAFVADIANAEGMDVTQVRRVMRVTLLAPEVIERLVGAPDMVLEQVMRRPWPSGWEDQSKLVNSL
ncbi:MAG: hypothetical protein V5B35_04075 [Candidatus Accumulibacter necessarius]|jgi:hypothetical protein|uniref:hypothetical protein n=1 Tax=Candidatus Accumulibacter necessarius TaxID=2954386 RepID=UPI002FC283E7